ncbi:hypothetical protein HU200_007120 [Digitaria exilis]|uniref:Uncharacterized protein n=1 Tax=Digitaria exilis TaxID=1010633 RepID=A0A835FN31_9POAL|nr:hypothetical protein HU200_007120 [Digitaria exilis]
MGQMVKFGRTLSQIGVSRVDAKEGWQQKLNEQRNLELYSKIPKHSEYFEPEETENHIQVAKLHSRSQSLSSAEIFYLLSVNSISALSGNGTLDKCKDDNGDNTVNLNEEIKQRVDEIRALLSSGNVHRTKFQKYKTRHTNCMMVGPVAEWLKAKLMNIMQRQYGRNREDKRLQTAQMHAALSLARLSTVVAGTIGNCSFGSNNLSGSAMTDRREDTNTKMHAAIASAAALVAASCAEAAKSAGASREQVSSVINMGLETRALGDLLTLTTSAAACIRGVDGLKMRTISNCPLESQIKSQKDAILLVRTPRGRFHTRMVSVHCKYDNIILTLGRKSCFTTSKKYVIFHQQGEGEEFSYPRDAHNYRAMNLSTSGGTIQLLFEEHEQYRSWRAFISCLMNNKGRNGNQITESSLASTS